MSVITISPGANIQQVIDSAASGTEIDFAPGTYTFSQTVALKSGVSLVGAPGAILQSNGSSGIFEGLGVQNVTISGFTLDGNGGGPGQTSGAIYLDSSTGDNSGTPSNNIHIVNNTFQNWTNSNDLWLWRTQNTYVQGNTLTSSYEGLTWATDPGSPALSNLVFSDNVISGMQTDGVETAFASTISGLHIDRNTISNVGDMALSIVQGQGPANIQSGTVDGNHLDGAKSGGVLLELGSSSGSSVGPFNVTVQGNVLSNAQWGMMFSHAAGAAVLDNTFTNVANPFSDDGGYDGTQWIGANSVNGATQTGWSGQGVSAEPALYSASALLSATTGAGTTSGTSSGTTSGTGSGTTSGSTPGTTTTPPTTTSSSPGTTPTTDPTTPSTGATSGSGSASGTSWSGHHHRTFAARSTLSAASPSPTSPTSAATTAAQPPGSDPTTSSVTAPTAAGSPAPTGWHGSLAAGGGPLFGPAAGATLGFAGQTGAPASTPADAYAKTLALFRQAAAGSFASSGGAAAVSPIQDHAATTPMLAVSRPA